MVLWGTEPFQKATLLKKNTSIKSFQNISQMLLKISVKDRQGALRINPGKSIFILSKPHLLPTNSSETGNILHVVLIIVKYEAQNSEIYILYFILKLLVFMFKFIVSIGISDKISWK